MNYWSTVSKPELKTFTDLIHYINGKMPLKLSAPLITYNNSKKTIPQSKDRIKVSK